MDNGLELTTDGYVLHPKRSGYWIAALVGLAGATIGVFIVGTLVISVRHSTLLVAGITALIFAVLSAIGWFTSLPPRLTVTRDALSLLGGAHRRRTGRSHVTGVTRALGAHRDKTYSIALDSDPREIDIPLRHFNPAGLEEAMKRLGVRLDGDFSR
jgi:hypothetical protein